MTRKKAAMEGAPPVASHGKKCGAKNRSGGRCGLPAGKGTDHLGVGRCKFHGGNVIVRHGLYSKVKSKSLQKLIAEYEADPDPMNLKREVARIRALAHDYLNKHGQEGFDYEAATKLLEAASRVIKRIEDIRAQNAISRADLLRVMGEMGRVVERHIEDEDTRERIKDGWLSIRL